MFCVRAVEVIDRVLEDTSIQMSKYTLDAFRSVVSSGVRVR
jgi:hypothetical protein